MKLTGIVIECNYPDDTAEAAVPSEMTVEELQATIKKLVDSEPDMTSFTITAAVTR